MNLGEKIVSSLIQIVLMAAIIVGGGTLILGHDPSFNEAILLAAGILGLSFAFMKVVSAIIRSKGQ